MKKLRIALLILAGAAILTPTVTSAKWGYAQERPVKQAARQFIRDLKGQGIDAQFKFYEDGSWSIIGCVSDGLCQD
jgi:hypothetical protein